MSQPKSPRDVLSGYELGWHSFLGEEQADELINDLDQAGYVIVPKKPTQAMLDAARGAEHDHYWPNKRQADFTWMSIPVMVVTKIWRAMVEAA